MELYVKFRVLWLFLALDVKIYIDLGFETPQKNKELDVRKNILSIPVELQVGFHFGFVLPCFLFWI